MRKFFAIALILSLASAAAPCISAQKTMDDVKERRAMRKEFKKDFNEKSTKYARKEAKNFEKDGWKVAPGAMPIEKQLDRAYQYDDNEYIIAEGMSVGANYDAAKMQAIQLAKQNIAGLIQTEVAQIIESDVSNMQLSPTDAASLTKSVSASKSRIYQNLGRCYTIMEVYRTLKNGNKEVLVRLAYSYDLALQDAKKAIINELEEEGVHLHNELDDMLK